MALTDDQIRDRAIELRNQLIRDAQNEERAEPRADDASTEGLSLVDLLATAISYQLKFAARVEELEREVAALKQPGT